MRLIARLDVKGDHVIKGVQMEGLRKVGRPIEMARTYYDRGVGEIFFIDCVASLYGRNNLFGVIEAACKEIFVPITIGGGLRSVEDVETALSSGADKVAINTAAVAAPGLITAIASRYGSQCVVASIQAKRRGDNWEAYVDSGRERTGQDVVTWARRLEDLGAGELLVTSIDRDGTRSGFDTALCAAINDAVRLPVVVSGGLGTLDHIKQLTDVTMPSGFATASALHYDLLTIESITAKLNELS